MWSVMEYMLKHGCIRRWKYLRHYRKKFYYRHYFSISGFTLAMDSELAVFILAMV